MVTLTVPLTTEQLVELVRQLSPEELVARLSRYGLFVRSGFDAVQDCRDPKDNYLLSIAQAGLAEVILSEDHDLLVLNPWRGIPVLRLTEFQNQFPLEDPAG